MLTKFSVPFFDNAPDDTHCVQSCYKMLLKYFEPSREYTWEELEKITGKDPGMYTWPMTGLIWLTKNGYEVKYIEDFDYEKFKHFGKKYLVEKYGKESANSSEKHSNISNEMVKTDDFLKFVKVENRIPEIFEIIKYIEKGYLVIAMVNYKSLHNKEGFNGHAVLIIGFDEENLILHDPGLPGIANLEVSYEQFIKGWSYPDNTVNNITAIKIKK